MLHVARDEDEVFVQGGGADEQVHAVDALPHALQLPAYVAILAHTEAGGVMLEEPLNLYHIVEVLLAPRFVGTKVELSDGEVGNLALADTHAADVLHHGGFLLDEGDADAGVQQIGSSCQHGLPSFNGS